MLDRSPFMVLCHNKSVSKSIVVNSYLVTFRIASTSYHVHLDEKLWDVATGKLR